MPYPYEKAYALWVEEPRLIEQRVHQALTTHRENKEWFRCSVERARETLEKIAGPEAEAETECLIAEDKAKAERLIAEAEAKAQRLVAEAEAEAERLIAEADERDRDFFIEIDLRRERERERRERERERRERERNSPMAFWWPVLIFLCFILIGSC